jgi:hypothetical protein
MYGKWLYKEISTEYGACKVEIYRKNYTGESIEIGALAADSLSIALENLGSITDPIGKSVCSFSIIDTNQVEYDDFFTPDATALKVVVSTRVGGGAYVTRWSGYVTPDFFAENLSYRTPISISARDNIGYLNDVDFDLTATTITVRELIQSAFRKIAEDYPMSLSFVTQKQTAEGILAIDATISTTLLKEMSWGEALETILHDLGLQMRWVDNNTIAVLDLSQIPEYYATQGFNFVDASGYREIVPAWRELSQEQDFGLKENFFEGWLREDNITFVKTENIRIPLSMGGVTGLVPMRYYTPNNWGVAGNTFVINPKDYVYFGTYGQMAQPFGERIFFTGVEKDATNIANNYMSYRQDVYASNRPMRITFKAFTSVMATGGIGNNDALLAYDPANRFMDFATGDTLQLGLKVNLLLHVGTRTYILGQNWEEINGAETNSLYFVLPKIGQVDGSSVTPNEEEITIDVNTIPNDGVLELRIYGFTIHNKTNLQEDAGSAIYDWLRMVSYINEVKYTYNIDNPDTGRYSQVEVNKQHNIKDTQSYTFGQIPVEGGAVNAFAGGLFKADGNELIGFQRNADATNYNLLELVGREIIHFNKRNYNRLSGTIRNLNKEPLMFNRLFVREGKKYAPYNYSLNVISNEMNITSMQEVEQYETATFNTIDSQITTGGGTVSGGNNTILQYSEEAGNEKRLYELQTATEQEQSDAYVLVDKAGFPEARKVHVSELGGFDVRELEQYLESNGYATLKRIWEVDSANAVVRTTYNIVSEQEIISCRRASGSGSGGGGGISEITAQMITDALGYVPYSSLNPARYITSAALAGYATETWVSSNYQPKGNYLTSVSWGDVSGKPSFATVATSGKYSDLSGTPSSLPASDVYDWAKAATKPSYTASEVGALSTSGGTITGPLKLTDSLELAYSSTALSVITPYGQSWFGMMNDSFCHIYTNAPAFYMDKPLYVDNGNAVIHSGNIGSYNAGGADVLISTYANQSINFGQESRVRMIIGTDANATSLGYPRAYTSGLSVVTSYTGWQIVTYGGPQLPNPFFRKLIDGGTWLDWKELAFLTDNVASATKLQTGRYLWGNYFNGEQNISSALFLNSGGDGIYVDYNGINYHNSNNGWIATNINFQSNGGLWLSPYGGNVLIGSTDDNGAKLQVEGAIPNLISVKRTTNGGGAFIDYTATNASSRQWRVGSSGSGDFVFENSSEVVLVSISSNGNLTATGEVISSRRASSSDARLKDNINRLIAEDCLVMVRNLQPSSWQWKEDGKFSLGFIAQDIEPLMPYAVTKIKDDVLGQRLNLQYDQFFAPVVGAIQCLDSEVEQLKKRVKYLENKL